MSELFDKIFGSFPEMRLMKEELMAKHTTFRIGGPAEVYACPNQEQLPALLEAAKKENAEVTVIGSGSIKGWQPRRKAETVSFRFAIVYG